MWSFSNPVAITFGPGALSELPRCIARRRYALVTYPDEPFQTLRTRIEALAGSPAVVIDSVKPNPDFGSIAEACDRWSISRTQPEIIVAVGGGSAIDTAKALSAASGDFLRIRSCLDGTSSASDLHPIPLIAVPTTAGTGSEVTMWATIWDGERGRKYSLSSPRLYAEAAIIDPEVSVGMPRELTISTGLDALSHALESIWNRNANPVSAHFAVAAAHEILNVLPSVAEDLANRPLRARMAQAALFAGLAFSNTKTALAHSLSYPITLDYGVPHGIACSFTLPIVMRSAIGQDAACDATLQRIFGGDLGSGAERLERFLNGLGVSSQPADHGVPAGRWRQIVSNALTGERGRNFIARDEHVIGTMGLDALS